MRNLRRLGIAESIAMRISGHVTSGVFKRYDIGDEQDLIQVADLLDAKRKLSLGKVLGIDEPTARKAPITKLRN